MVILQDNLREGPRYWRESLLEPLELQQQRKEMTDYKNFLSSLQTLNSPGKLRNFALGQGEVRHELRSRKKAQEIIHLFEVVGALASALDYIYQAEITLPADDPWQAESARVGRAIGCCVPLPVPGNDYCKVERSRRIYRTPYIQRYLSCTARHAPGLGAGREKKRIPATRAGGNCVLERGNFLNRVELQKLEDR